MSEGLAKPAERQPWTEFAGARDFIIETADIALVQLELIQRYAALGDTVGLERATRSLIACTKAVGGTVKEMKQLRDEIEGRQG